MEIGDRCLYDEDGQLVLLCRLAANRSNDTWVDLDLEVLEVKVAIGKFAGRLPKQAGDRMHVMHRKGYPSCWKLTKCRRQEDESAVR